jgi:hypothetical protein
MRTRSSWYVRNGGYQFKAVQIKKTGLLIPGAQSWGSAFPESYLHGLKAISCAE